MSGADEDGSDHYGRGTPDLSKAARRLRTKTYLESTWPCGGGLGVEGRNPRFGSIAVTCLLFAHPTNRNQPPRTSRSSRREEALS